MEGGGGRVGELIIEYGADAGRTPGDAGLQTSLLRMERDEDGGEGGRGLAGPLIFSYQMCLWAYVTFNSWTLLLVSTGICLFQNAT